MTTNVDAISAWKAATITTGDPVLDHLTSLIGVDRIGPQYGNPGGPGSPWYFVLDEHVVYDEDALNQALSGADSYLAAPQVRPRDDGTWSWSGSAADIGSLANSTAQVDFTFGWGDCLVACDGFHTLRAVIPPQGNATVYDLGGDALPQYITLSPDTKPLQ